MNTSPIAFLRASAVTALRADALEFNAERLKWRNIPRRPALLSPPALETSQFDFWGTSQFLIHGHLWDGGNFVPKQVQ